MKQFTIQVTNNETGKTKQLDLEGYILMAVGKREGREFESHTFADEIDPEEIAHLFNDFENDNPEVTMARIMLIQAERAGKMGPTPGCDCPVCTEKRQAASNPTS